MSGELLVWEISAYGSRIFAYLQEYFLDPMDDKHELKLDIHPKNYMNVFYPYFIAQFIEIF